VSHSPLRVRMGTPSSFANLNFDLGRIDWRRLWGCRVIPWRCARVVSPHLNPAVWNVRLWQL